MNFKFSGLAERLKKIEPALYIFLILVLLFPVWVNKYFITQDSPTHLYNARIFLDYILGRNTDFYNQYYHATITAFPYWFGHISLGLLLWLFPTFIVEKLIFSIYIILFAYVTRKIICLIDKESGFLSYLILPFACNYGFQMGFISFLYSFIFFCYIISFYLNNKTDFRIRHTFIIALLFVITYFSHPVFWGFSIFIVFTLWGFSVLSCTNDIKSFLREVKKTSRVFFLLLLSIIPSVLLFAQFMITHPNVSSTKMKIYTMEYILNSFLNLKTLVLVSEKEIPFALIIGIIIAILLVISIINKIQSKSLTVFDGFYLATLVALFLDIYGSINLIGFLERLQFLPFILLIFWFASFKFHSIIKYSVISFSFIITITLVAMRYPTYNRAYSTLDELLSAQPYIKEKSTILFLGFNQSGIAPDGKEVTSFTNPYKLILFVNSGNYFGANKPLIVLDNAGALYSQCFPYTWRPDKCVFSYIQEPNSMDGIYGEPPNVDLLSYTAKTKGSIDYVLLRNYDVKYASNPRTINLFRQLGQEYKEIFISKTGIARLFKKVGPEDLISDIQKNSSEENQLRLCKYYFNNNNYVECAEISEEIISKYPSDSAALAYGGASYIRLDQLQKSITYLTKSLKLNPENSFAINELQTARQVNQADSIFKITSNPQELISLSYIYYINKLFEKGIISCEKALAISPDNADAYNNICACYNSMEKWEMAIKACKKALAINPNLELAKNNLKWALSQLKK